MPPVVAAAAISGGMALVGGLLQSRSNRSASKAQERGTNAALQVERERDAEARRQWDIEQQNAERERIASEEERAYTRRLHEEREARQAPYRAASAAALGNLGNLLGMRLPGPSAPTGGLPGGPRGPINSGGVPPLQRHPSQGGPIYDGPTRIPRDFPPYGDGTDSTPPIMGGPINGESGKRVGPTMPMPMPMEARTGPVGPTMGDLLQLRSRRRVPMERA